MPGSVPLTETNAVLAAIVESSDDAIIGKTLDGTIQTWNRAAERIFGYTAAEAIGSHITLIIPPELHFEETEIISRIGRGERIAHFETIRRSKDGRALKISLTVSPIKDAAGLVVGASKIARDITESKNLEQALHQAQLELAHVARVTALGELSASIAHEINQPLAGVVTNGQAALRWLGQDPPRCDEVRSALERIVRDGKRASEVIGGIRAMAKKADPQKHSIDINDVINEGVFLVRGEVEGRGVSLRTEFASALPRVLGDRVQLQQVIINLLMNGAEATAQITGRPREIVIRSLQEAADVLVQVTDSGNGIDAANVERLFRPFYTTKSAGMGMGLSISRSIVTAHGGRLWASPNEDRGATFQFTLPIPGNDAP